MQKFKPNRINICLTLLSLTLLTQSVFGYDNRVSYLDSVSTSYMQSQPADGKSLLNLNSMDAKGIEATFRLDSNQPITNSNAKINVSLRDSDIRQALRMLADKAGVNIAFDESVVGRVTLDLKNVNVNDAFMVVFKSCQLTYFMEGNTVTVMTLEKAKDVAYTRKNMTVLPVKYVNAESVAEFLNDNLFNSNIFGLSSQPIVTSNPRTNQIVVFGSGADVMAVKRVLPVLDTKPMVNNFKVNHTTPKEMATLICDSLFYDADSSKTSSSSETDMESEEVVLGGGVVACRDEVSSGSSSSSSINRSRNGSNGTTLAAFKANPLTITYFSELGKIGVYGGSVEQVEIIKEFIKEHDKKQLMAYVELSVIELNETGSKEFSNEWNLWTPFISLGFRPDEGLTTTSPFFIWGNQYPTTVTSTTVTGDTTTTDTTTEIITKSNNRALVYQLKYLVENGNGRVLTNPKIMVTNGKKATIDMTSDYVKSVTSQVLQGSSTVTSATQRTYDIGSDEGLMIEIVPFISPDGYVSMNITPEFATIKERVYTTGDSGAREIAATLLQRRDLELRNIRIKDGETLVLAGLIKENETQTIQKMPLISDLPFIGAFFRNNTTSKTREELVIVVTPHIIKDGDEPTSDQIYDL